MHPGLAELERSRARPSVLGELFHWPREADRGIFAGDQAAIDLDLAPVGHDVDALPPLDPADRQRRRAENRVGRRTGQHAGVLLESLEHASPIR